MSPFAPRLLSITKRFVTSNVSQKKALPFKWQLKLTDILIGHRAILMEILFMRRSIH